MKAKERRRIERYDPNFRTTHNLLFEVASSDKHGGFLHFRVGTCRGLWQGDAKTYYVLAIENTVPGNGHFDDVMEWFEHSCIRDKRNLVMLCVANHRLKNHLIGKRSFVEWSRSVESGLVKEYQKMIKERKEAKTW